MRMLSFRLCVAANCCRGSTGGFSRLHPEVLCSVLRLQAGVEVGLQSLHKEVHVVSPPVKHPPPLLFGVWHPGDWYKSSRQEPSRNHLVQRVQGVNTIHQPNTQTVKRPTTLAPTTICLHAVELVEEVLDALDHVLWYSPFLKATVLRVGELHHSHLIFLHILL